MTSRIKLGFCKFKTPSTFHPNDVKANHKIFMPYGNTMTDRKGISVVVRLSVASIFNKIMFRVKFGKTSYEDLHP